MYLMGAALKSAGLFTPWLFCRSFTREEKKDVTSQAPPPYYTSYPPNYTTDYSEGEGLTVTTMSPLLRGLFAALPACAWDIVDQKVTSTYFELLEEQISRDEFIMINDVPLVVSTLGGDK